MESRTRQTLTTVGATCTVLAFSGMLGFVSAAFWSIPVGVVAGLMSLAALGLALVWAGEFAWRGGLPKAALDPSRPRQTITGTRADKIIENFRHGIDG